MVSLGKKYAKTKSRSLSDLFEQYLKTNEFEDALQHQSCLSNNKIEYIVTRNHKDFKNSTLAIFTLETALRLLLKK